jgi:hypothetical protein
MDVSQQDHQRNGSYDLSPLTNPPPNFFGGNGTEPSPTVANFDFNEAQLDGQDQDGGHDENDPKRRRIARVRIGMINRLRFGINDVGRPVTCAGRRRSNAMGKCQHVHIASTTRRNVFLHNLRRSAILRKGNAFMI